MRYRSDDPAEKAFGGRVEITLADGSRIVDEIAVADAHPLGARPFGRADYIAKFETLAEGIASEAEQRRFLDLVIGLEGLDATALAGLTPAADLLNLQVVPDGRGIFDA